MSSSTTLTQLINLLTRPLIFTHPATTIVQLQLALQANLSTLFRTQPFAPFTLHLSAHALPIPPIYAACLTLGLSWESWATALSGGKDLYVFVMEGCIRVGVPNMQETVVVWKESSETKPSTTASKLQAMLDSARARKQANAQATSEKPTLTLPALRITPSTPLLSSPSEPSSPVSASSSSSSSADSDLDLDSDSDSDTESTFSSHSSHSSISSISSTTKPCSNAFGIPFFIPTTTTTTTATTAKATITRAIPHTRAQKRREWIAQASARTLNPNANPKATVTKYNYQGGQTGVMTGGVMLGGSGSGVAVAATTTGSGSGAGAANWRRGSSSRRV